MPLDRFGRQSIALKSALDAAVDHRGQIDRLEASLDRFLIEPGRVEQMIDQIIEPL